MTMNCGNFGELTDDQITAVMQLTYQLIVSANHGMISESDDPSIDVMMQKMGFTDLLLKIFGNAHWNDAINMNPYLAFMVVSDFSQTQKNAFKELILAVARKDNTFLRMDIARQIFNKTGIL